MTAHSGVASQNCRVVIGADAVVAARTEDPLTAVVALVDTSQPTESILAQTAGADVVLAVANPHAEDQPAGLALAMQAAIAIANRRRNVAETSRSTSHDMAEVLNVISLVSEAGLAGRVDSAAAFELIQNQIRDSGDVLWRAGHGHRSSSEVLSVAELGQLAQGLDLDVAVLSDADSPAAVPPALWDSGADLSAAQADILEGVVQHAPLSQSLEGIVSAIEGQLPGTKCSLLLLADKRLYHGAGAQLPLAYREAIDGVAIGLGQGSCGTAAFTGRPVIASDVTTDPNWIDFRAIATEHGLRSCWSTPIVAAEDGETLGTFAVYQSTVWSPDAEAIRLVNRFSYLAAVAIEHHRLFGALAESEARFRSAFEGAAAGIVLATVEGEVLKSNPALGAVVGPTAAGLVGTNLVDLVDPMYRQMVLETWAGLADDNPTRVDTVEAPLRALLNGSQRWLSLKNTLIAGESGRQPYLYVEIHDITAPRRQLADMRAREAAEAANRAKTDFLALASHELRTPLNAILGFAQVMQLLDLDEEQRDDSVDHILNAGRHLRDLIDELLDLSRIEAGHLAVELRPVDAHTVIDEAIEIVGPLAAARYIELVSPTVSDIRPMVLADPQCMRQVLINLLDNAVKYSAAGGRVAISIRPADEGAAETTRVSVRDAGAGISAESLEAIFEPFHRLQPEGDGVSEGSGLGLALCDRLMREMNGGIGVDSTVGVGSSFWIEFPAVASIADGDPDVGPRREQIVDLGSGAPTAKAVGRVLYIEDDPVSIDVMGEALRLRPGITLIAAHTSVEATAALASDVFDLVLLDIGLPDRSGWDVLPEIRRSHPSLPVIVLTAGPDLVPEGVEGPDLLFTKPVDVTEVLRGIDGACSGATNSDHLGEAMDPMYQ